MQDARFTWVRAIGVRIHAELLYESRRFLRIGVEGSKRHGDIESWRVYRAISDFIAAILRVRPRRHVSVVHLQRVYDSLTVDRHGNVYEADEDGYVNQYSQRNNTTVQKACPPRRSAVPTALTVDNNGNVFLSYYSDSGAGGLFEYVGGLGTCHGPVHLNAMGDRRYLRVRDRREQCSYRNRVSQRPGYLRNRASVLDHNEEDRRFELPWYFAPQKQQVAIRSVLRGRRPV
jgi:hypothetical protein